MHYDNKEAIHIPSNPEFHEDVKHVKVDYHFIQNVVLLNNNYTLFKMFFFQNKSSTREYLTF